MTSWNPLPTLDINDTDPDILYTVELYLITCGQNIPIHQTEVAGNNVTEEGVDLKFPKPTLVGHTFIGHLTIRGRYLLKLIVYYSLPVTFRDRH